MTDPATSGRWKPLVAIALAAIVATACGGGGSKKTAANPGATGGLFSKLPADIQAAKEIKVGSDVAYAPVEFFKEGTQQVEGLDYDIGQALGAKLGVRVTFTAGTFDGLIPALQAKRFDMLMSAMTDNKSRQGQVDFVDYFTAGTGILLPKGNPKHISSLDDLCGKTVTLQRGTTQADIADAQAQKCQTDGKPKMTVLKFDKDTG
jgi:polar amino acid transport system substrate-binding protein